MEIPAPPAPPGLSIGLCVPSSPPVQLELLPLYPTPHPPSPCSPSLPWQRACMSSRGIIDVNQIPSTPDCYETVSFFSNAFKRERDQKLSDSDYERERAYEVTSRVGSDEDEAGQPRKKLRLSKEQSALLEESFKEHSTLNPKQKNTLAKQLSLRPRQVEVWFQNRRARTKLKQTEVDCELLKRWCESLTEENRRLQKELQELKAIRVASPCVIRHDMYMPLPAATLSMCPSCQRLTTPENRSLPLFSNPNNKSQLFPQPSAAG